MHPGPAIHTTRDNVCAPNGHTSAVVQHAAPHKRSDDDKSNNSGTTTNTQLTGKPHSHPAPALTTERL